MQKHSLLPNTPLPNSNSTLLKTNPMTDFTRIFIREKGLNRHHIDSFNYFVDTELRRVLGANNFIDSDVDPSFYLKYTDIRVEPPTIEENMVKRHITPEECRIRNLTYTGDILVDVEYTRGKDIVISKNVLIGKMPIMLGSHLSLQKPSTADVPLPFQTSKHIIPIQNPIHTRPARECPFDIGGYFICKGVERVLLMQEQLAKNRILIELDFRGDLSAVVTSSSLERKSKTKLVLKKKLVYLAHNSLSEDIPLQVVLKGMGITTDFEINTLLGHFLPPLPPIRTQLEALAWIGAKIKTRSGGIDEARIFLHDILLAHVPCTPTDMRKKAEYLALMAQMLLQNAEDPSQNDKDFVGNKRIELAGQMLSLLFEDLLKRLNSEMKKALDRVLCKRARAQELDALHFLVMNRSLVSTGLLRAISTGSWSLKRFRMDRAGVTQVLSRLSRLSAIGMSSRVSSQFEKTRKVSGPRALHCSQWGLFCPADTPEGEACGLVKSLATLAEISSEEKEDAILHYLSYLGVEDLFVATTNPKCWVNGLMVGQCRNPMATAQQLRDLRRAGRIPSSTGIWVATDLFISTEAGRLARPLVIVVNGQPRVTPQEMAYLVAGYKTVQDFVAGGLIEYIDQNEAKNANIATWKEEITAETTHLEIDPSSILGYIAGVIPYPHHNQSPRNTYQCAMGKQGVGVTGVDIRRRMDGANFFLVHTQRPLAATRAMEIIQYTDLPAGQNLTVAVMSMTGYDIEDALILNQASIDRGVGRAILMKTHSLSLRTYPGGTADSITGTGIPPPGMRVAEGETLIDRRTPFGTKAGAVYRGLDPAHVDRTVLTRTGDDLVTIKTVLRENRVPRIGDKFSSRHGQKGVVGLVLPQEDMPFNEQGISPDLVMNPHGFPSRMTVGKILELVTGKAIANGSQRLNQYAASAFGGVTAKDIAAELVNLGFSASGKETLTCGTTGKRIPVMIFFGPVFYQRLKHMVSDKMHARARGPRAVLTRQPTEGRCRDGGFRLGEMERDCLIGYGASEMLIERLVVSSDRYMVYICSACGLIVHSNECLSCQQPALKVQLPYACKLLFQELVSMKIAPRVILKKTQ
ncbi:DNA-directed RNA polymerase III subunit RPC2 [Nematocida homosporus]|uniref:DNA-directed RNA polymerase III subunit RPC2 n=1 Tax=Nematocida homosporus TaxID=1912981 RepID=UPI0022201813|nr:DNA-directed RNA polymerase III subunit RPC2 [Nematocida homosporus]KAI5186917.1 DNA-directed RNA polymerase III subunit RPC2 [Nematocida homosporus]